MVDLGVQFVLNKGGDVSGALHVRWVQIHDLLLPRCLVTSLADIYRERDDYSGTSEQGTLWR